jgi:sulfonate transport system substrate-binding protein
VALLAAAVLPLDNKIAQAADQIVLRVGDQKGGNRSLLEISGLTHDLLTRSNGRNSLPPLRFSNP